MNEIIEITPKPLRPRTCAECCKVKSIEGIRRTNGGRLFYCKDCLLIMGKIENYEGVRFFRPGRERPKSTNPLTKKPTPLSFLKLHIRSCINREFKEWRAIEEPDITMTYMMNLFVEQKGLCALTGRSLVLSALNRRPARDGLSIDRIDSKRGYIIGNVRYVTFQVNIAKSRFTDEEFISMCRDIVRKSGG